MRIKVSAAVAVDVVTVNAVDAVAAAVKTQSNIGLDYNIDYDTIKNNS